MGESIDEVQTSYSSGRTGQFDPMVPRGVHRAELHFYLIIKYLLVVRSYRFSAMPFPVRAELTASILSEYCR